LLKGHLKDMGVNGFDRFTAGCHCMSLRLHYT